MLALVAKVDGSSITLIPAQSYEYTPYGTPAIHAPANPSAENVWSEQGRLAVKTPGVFATVGNLYTDNLLDAADIGRPATAGECCRSR